MFVRKILLQYEIFSIIGASLHQRPLRLLCPRAAAAEPRQSSRASELLRRADPTGSACRAAPPPSQLLPKSA